MEGCLETADADFDGKDDGENGARYSQDEPGRPGRPAWAGEEEDEAVGRCVLGKHLRSQGGPAGSVILHSVQPEAYSFNCLQKLRICNGLRFFPFQENCLYSNVKLKLFIT